MSQQGDAHSHNVNRNNSSSDSLRNASNNLFSNLLFDNTQNISSFYDNDQNISTHPTHPSAINNTRSIVTGNAGNVFSGNGLFANNYIPSQNELDNKWKTSLPGTNSFMWNSDSNFQQAYPNTTMNQNTFVNTMTNPPVYNFQNNAYGASGGNISNENRRYNFNDTVVSENNTNRQLVNDMNYSFFQPEFQIHNFESNEINKNSMIDYNVSNNYRQQHSANYCEEQEKQRMIVVLSLLQDMVTAIEITESREVNSQKTEKKSVITSASTRRNDTNSELWDTSNYIPDEKVTLENYPADIDDLDEECSGESEEFEEQQQGQTSQKQTKKKKKTFNQRKNIRNVFEDKHLDAKVQLLREKEKERLQRLGLKQSIENTGKMLRAHVKKTVEEKKTPCKEEVICLDSESEDDVPRNESKSSSGKETILVHSSDSEEDGEDGEEFDELVQSKDYYSELGLHTNDSLNVPNSNNKVLVNVNHIKDDKDIFLHPSIGNNLKPHQIGGVRFLFDNLIESVSHFRPDEGNGCILAHAMGLGKTIQTITFINLFLSYTSGKKVLCVVPVTTIQNWMNEFNKWLPPANKDDSNLCNSPKVALNKSKKMKFTKEEEEENAATVQNVLEDMVGYVVEHQVTSDVKGTVNKILDDVCQDDHKRQPYQSSGSISSEGGRNFEVFLIDAHKNLAERAKIIEKWDKCGGVLLAGYEMYRSIAMYKVMSKSKGKTVKKSKKLTDENGDVLLRLKKIMCKPGPDLVVCDEGHRIRNYQSGISQALKSIKTRKRLVLTGYPLQNNLIEYWCMVDFVRPNYLGSRQEFANMFERPIMNGQCVDSTPKDKHLMKQRAHVLYSLLQGFVQRRGHDVFSEILPNKEEHVLMIRLSPIQKKLYNKLMELTRDAYRDSLNPVKTFSLCCKIWNHPDILYDAIALNAEGKKVDIIGDEDDIALDDGTGRQKRKRKQQRDACDSPYSNGLLQSNIGFDPFGTEAKDLLTDIVQWASPIFKEFPYTHGTIENSGKFVVLRDILNQALLCGDKVLLFSQSLLTLNAIETMLQNNYLNYDGTHWRKGRDYYRLDGGTNSIERERLINAFNDAKNKETNLFILSTRAGCLGINLVAANRVVVFDVSWNPSHDAQAVCRIYRYGQKKSCHIYRLVSSNTMEKKIYYRQLSKQGISDRVVDEANLTENFSKNEIQSLVIEEWVDEPYPDFSTSFYSFDDPALLNVLYTSPQWVTKMPFEHESLLINESSQKLSGSEKRAAKREYEKERMMAHGSMTSSRPYPLQQSFPQNTPVAPVRPFLWRPPLTTSWLRNPNTLFNDTLSQNTPVTSSLSSNDPLLILRNSAYNSDHSYSDQSNSTNRNSYYWRNIDDSIQASSSSLSANLSNVLNRTRSLLHIGSQNNPLARLTQSVTDLSSSSSSSTSSSVTSAFTRSTRTISSAENWNIPVSSAAIASIENSVILTNRTKKVRKDVRITEHGLMSSSSDDSETTNTSTAAPAVQKSQSSCEIIVLDDDDD